MDTVSHMTQRHPIVSDRIMLITTNTIDRVPYFANPVYAREAIECMYRTQQFHPYFLYGFVIMPDHCHFLMNVPSPNTVAKVMNSYKSGLTFDIGVPKLWQKRFHIRLADDPHRALSYIHENPMRKNLCESSDQYPWSSASGQWDIEPLPLM
jgi:putative transposase